MHYSTRSSRLVPYLLHVLWYPVKKDIFLKKMLMLTLFGRVCSFIIIVVIYYYYGVLLDYNLVTQCAIIRLQIAAYYVKGKIKETANNTHTNDLSPLRVKRQAFPVVYCCNFFRALFVIRPSHPFPFYVSKRFRFRFFRFRFRFSYFSSTCLLPPGQNGYLNGCCFMATFYVFRASVSILMADVNNYRL